MKAFLLPALLLLRCGMGCNGGEGVDPAKVEMIIAGTLDADGNSSAAGIFAVDTTLPIISGSLNGSRPTDLLSMLNEVLTPSNPLGQFQMKGDLHLLSNATYRLRLDSSALFNSMMANSVLTLVLTQEQARAIVAKAIQAQGGEAQVARLRRMRIKAEGTIALVPGEPELPFTIEDVWQMPARYKSKSTFQIAGRKVAQTLVINGDKVWIHMKGQTEELPKNAVAEMKEQKYAEDLDRCAFLDERGIELSLLDSIEVEGKPAVGVLVKSPGHRDVRLYFDINSGLLAKREHRLFDPVTGKEALQEVIFSDYQEKEGLKHYKRFVAYRDGTQIFDATVTEVECFDKLDEEVFAKP